MAWINSSFATFLIVCPTSFFLGLLFSLLPYDYPLLWSGAAAPLSHYALYEAHLTFLYGSPALIVRLLHIAIFLGLLGFIIKLYRPSESNMLFDGGSLVLYMCAVIVYLTNIVKGLRVVSSGTYEGEMVLGEAELNAGGSVIDTVVSSDGAAAAALLGREDTMKVLAASNTICALVLVGVLVLQSGQWYAEKKQREEEMKMDEDEREKAAASLAGEAKGRGVRREASGSKKKN